MKCLFCADSKNTVVVNSRRGVAEVNRPYLTTLPTVDTLPNQSIERLRNEDM